MTHRLDRRTTPARPDLAASFLAGQVDALAFVEGATRTVIAALAPLRREPRAGCPLDTEAIRGELANVYEEAAGWAWLQLARDGYVGYAPSAAFGTDDPPTHKVTALRTLVFPEANLKLPVCSALPFGARLSVRDIAGRFAKIGEGWVSTNHLAPLDAFVVDFVAVAERFVDVPYLWGGKSSLGIDCSGLVQVALDAAGVDAPRDSDLQQNALGVPVADGVELRRGDLVFWPGHVGIMRDADTVLHANAHAMMVSSEPLAQVQARAEAQSSGGHPTFKRLA